MLSIHNNFSAGAQNVIGAYVIIMLVNNALTSQTVHDVIKYMQKHRVTVTNYITCKPGFRVT